MPMNENLRMKCAGVAGLRARARIESYKAFKLRLIKIAPDNH